MSADDSKARSRGVASFLLKLGGFARAKKSPGLPWEAKPPESIDSCRFIHMTVKKRGGSKLSWWAIVLIST